MISYREALDMGKEKLNKVLIPSKVKKAKKRAELEMCELEEKIATQQGELQDLCVADELNFKKIIEKQDSIALLERSMAQYQEILDGMFPEG